jgi:hypothetical protein
VFMSLYLEGVRAYRDRVSLRPRTCPLLLVFWHSAAFQPSGVVHFFCQKRKAPPTRCF